MDQRRRERLGDESALRLGFVATVLALLTFGAAAVLQVRDARDDAAVADARAINAVAAADIADHVDRSVAAVAGLAIDAAVDGPTGLPAAVPGLERIAFVPADPDRTLTRALLTEGIDVVALRPWLDRARDSVDGPVLAAPVGTPPASVIVEALFETPEGGIALAPSSSATEIRRAELAGYVAGVVDLDEVTALAGDGSWLLADGPVVLRSSETEATEASFADRSGDTVEIEIDIRQRRWRLVRAVDAASVDASAIALAVLLLVVVVFVAAMGRSVARTLRLRTDAALRARVRADTVATLSGVTRESNELGDILPGVAVQLADTLGLEGLALAVPSAAGSAREVFAHGARPDVDHAVRLREVDTVAAGQTVAIPLHRAGRTIAIFRVVTGRVLSADEIELLEVAAEMVTAAVVTARSIEQQQDAVARLQAVDELKTAFLGTASHELRTPVTAISGFAFVLVERWSDLGETERRVFAERIASNARALEALVQDLLDFARIERGDHAMAVEALDLPDVVASVLDRLAPVWEHHDIAADLGTRLVVLGDRAALERVITNLVSNAAKFSPEGSTIAVDVRREGDHASLTIDDHGPGVPPDERDKVFARFFRGRSQAVVRTRGVGIGLSVVKDFVDRMHGTIEVAESPAGGARFTVRFPIADDVASTVELEEGRDVPAT